jgi:predicted enzyme related to lactoylglutathione lyase
MNIVHFDVSGPDHDALLRFYAGVLEWKIEPQGPGYALVRTSGSGPDGALVETEDASLTLGVAVDDLEAAVARVAEHGGEVLMPPTDNGWVHKAIVVDPAGNRISLIARG